MFSHSDEGVGNPLITPGTSCPTDSGKSASPAVGTGWPDWTCAGAMVGAGFPLALLPLLIAYGTVTRELGWVQFQHLLPRLLLGVLLGLAIGAVCGLGLQILVSGLSVGTQYKRAVLIGLVFGLGMGLMIGLPATGALFGVTAAGLVVEIQNPRTRLALQSRLPLRGKWLHWFVLALVPFVVPVLGLAIDLTISGIDAF